MAEHVFDNSLEDVKARLTEWWALRDRLTDALDNTTPMRHDSALPNFDEVANAGFDVVEALGKISIGIESDIMRLLDALDQYRTNQRDVRDQQRRLLHEVCGDSNEAACKAINALRHKGWLTGEDAWLTGQEGILKGADLSLANLARTNLEKANLEGTNLSFATLINANLKDARFSIQTILPDGSRWTPKTDMRRFTDPRHIDFWYADDDDSDSQASALAWLS